MLYIAIALIILGVSVIFFSSLRKENEEVHDSVIVRKKRPLYSDDDILNSSVATGMDGYGSFTEQQFAVDLSGPRDIKDTAAADEFVSENTEGEYSGTAEISSQDTKEEVNVQVKDDSYAIPGGMVKDGVEKEEINNTLDEIVNKKEKSLLTDTSVFAVLFNDYSGELEYDGIDNIIDPTFGKYSALKRVGRGSIEIVKDGINFKLLKNLYRFDFHRIRDIQGGDEYIAVFLKGSDIIRLFLIENENDYGVKIIREYKRFSRKE